MKRDQDGNSFWRQGTMQTRRLVISGTIGLAGLSLAALTLSRAEEKPPAAPPLQAVTVAPVPEREIAEWDEFTGRLRAVDQVEIRTRVSGYTQQVTFTEDREVRKGEV